jgi:hypothetical protein
MSDYEGVVPKGYAPRSGRPTAALLAALSLMTLLMAAGSAFGKGSSLYPHESTSCRDFAAAHREYHLIGGNGPDSCLFRVPPSTFEPTHASALELQHWGLPPRPAVSPGSEQTARFRYDLLRWKRIAESLTSPKRREPTVIKCTETAAEFRGAPDQYTICGVTPDRQGALPRRFPTLPIPSEAPALFSFQDGADIGSKNLAGVLLTYDIRKHIADANTFAYFFGYGTAVSLVNPPAQCSVAGPGEYIVWAATWYGLYDQSAPANSNGAATGLDQAGVVSQYNCHTLASATQFFSEELPNLPSIYTCTDGTAVQPGDQYYVSIGTGVESSSKPVWVYPYVFVLGVNTQEGYLTCPVNGMIPPATQSTASQGQGVAVFTETQMVPPYVDAPLINPVSYLEPVANAQQVGPCGSGSGNCYGVEALNLLPPLPSDFPTSPPLRLKKFALKPVSTVDWDVSTSGNNVTVSDSRVP